MEEGSLTVIKVFVMTVIHENIASKNSVNHHKEMFFLTNTNVSNVQLPV